MNTNDGAVKSPQTVSLADEDAVRQILVSTAFGLWDIVNNLTRLRPSRPQHYRVTIFGSSRAKPGAIAYDEVKRGAGVLAEMGCDIVTGGGPDGSFAAMALPKVNHRETLPAARTVLLPGSRSWPATRGRFPAATSSA